MSSIDDNTYSLYLPDKLQLGHIVRVTKTISLILVCYVLRFKEMTFIRF